MVRKENNKLFLSQISLGLKPVEIEIYYSDDLVYSETVKDEKSIRRIFKLSRLKTGVYRTVIKTEDRTYINDFKL